MDINWAHIKTEMKREFGELFSQNNPSYQNIDEGIDLFQKVIFANISTSQLGGLVRTLPQALQEAYTTKIGEIGPLRILADNLEPYLKKICIIANLDTTEAILSKQLMPLLKIVNINSALTSQTNGGFPQLTQANLSSFKGQPEYLEYICDAYLTRNKVHEAPDWNRVMVLTKLTNLLVLYVYVALRYKNAIQANAVSDPALAQYNIREKISSDQKYLYHFISFGETTNKIRNQIVSSYVLNYLKENPRKKIEEIRERVNMFFATDMNLNYYQNLVAKLSTENKIVLDKESKEIQLSTFEYERISAVQKNFEENRNLFFLYLEDIASNYGITYAISDLFDRLREFIENNYNVDVAEAYSKGELIESDQNQVFQNFLQFLQSLTPDKLTAKRLFRDLIELSKDSDFLVRMCASKAFAALTNPDRFEQYIHQEDKIVYLDTQIILFALCLNYTSDPLYDNYYFKITDELISLANKNPSIKLRVSRLYLQEVTYQLKLALLLIPFEEISKGKFSSNVFFQFYWHLKKNDLLEDGDVSFGDFMASWLKLYEEDVYSSDFGGIVFSNLYEFLDELKIEVETLPNYDNREDAVSILNQVLDADNYKTRPKHVKANDAIMMCHLCDPDAHAVEPFFLTWDKTFTKFRKEFLGKYKRLGLMSFHLFNPARFLNHYTLIKLKINPQAITNEMLSILDSLEIHENTQTVWDSVNKFLSIENLTSQKRKRYIVKIKDLFENELNYSVDDIEDIEKTQRVLLPFEDILSRINEYYNTHSEYKSIDFRNLILDDNYFEKVSKLILQTISDPSSESSLFENLNILILEQRKSNEQTES